MDSFVVGAESLLFEEISADNRRGTLLLQGMPDEVSAISCHPQGPLVAFGCLNGNLHIWDYEMKILVNLREFNNKLDVAPKTANAHVSKTAKKIQDAKQATAEYSAFVLQPKSLAFEPSQGEILVIGFTNGQIKCLNVETLEDLCSFVPSSDPILGIRFSANGVFFAAFDSSRHVMLFQR